MNDVWRNQPSSSLRRLHKLMSNDKVAASLIGLIEDIENELHQREKASA